MTTPNGDALDLLWNEDVELRRIFTELQRHRGPSVQDRAAYGDLSKELVRAVAKREAALTEVARAIADAPTLRDIHTRFEADRTLRRPVLIE